MAEQKFIEYGGRRIPVPADMTQEQAKGQMARFYPELADPKVESKKDGDKTVWVFSKKAGTKGNGRRWAAKGVAAVAAQLARVKETPVAPDWLVAVAKGEITPAILARLEGRGPRRQGLESAISQIYSEGQAVVTLRGALQQLPPAWPKRLGDTLL